MGGLCSKESGVQDYVSDYEKDYCKRKCSKKAIVPPKRKKIISGEAKPRRDVSANSISISSCETNDDSVPVTILEGSVETTTDGSSRGQQSISRTLSARQNSGGVESSAGWPRWLSSVAGEAIKGWLPRSADSYEKISKIGQGTYSTVYRARDLVTNKIVAMKRVKFVNMDPESVRFMAREISILRRLDHPNVMKLEALVTSEISGSLYLVFEYMEHDLAGLRASSKVKFTEQQIKCFMQQLLRGLEHCHSRGILHRDIKGSNILVDNNGNLKIGDWGLATTYWPHQAEPMTSRVVTLWYRAPELLLGSTAYGPAIDMWSVGCILAELYTGTPIMPGRSEVEQMQKIFKLCGSPSDEYWRNCKLPHASSFKPQQPYKRRVSDTFKHLSPTALSLVDSFLSMEPNLRIDATAALNSQFFKTKPLPCDPSALPKYPPSKELEVKLQEEEEARRKKAVSLKGYGRISTTKSSKSAKVTPIDGKQGPSKKSTSVKITPCEGNGTRFRIEPPRVVALNGLPHSNSVVHPPTVNYGWASNAKHDSGSLVHGRALNSSRHAGEFGRQGSQRQQGTKQSSSLQRRDKSAPGQDSLVHIPKVKRIHISGPILPPGGNMDGMSKEHEKQVQEAVRKARHANNKTKKTCYE